MLNIFSKIIDPAKILQLQNVQYTEKIVVEGEIPASGLDMFQVQITSLGNFYSLFITGKFTTLYETVDNGSHVKDGGYSYLRARILDGINSKPLFNDFIPLDLFLSPGRSKSPLSGDFATDIISNNLFYPLPFQYMFAASSSIQVEVKNDSNYKNKFYIVFHGIRFPVAQEKKRQEMLRAGL